MEPSLRTLAYSTEENRDARAAELELITEGREKARIRTMEYQRRVKRAFDKHVVPRAFLPGDLVLKTVEATGKHVSKLAPQWEGPFKVIRSRGKDAFELEDPSGFILTRLWNACHLRKFYI